MPVPGFVKIIATTLILQVANPQSFAMSESRYEWLFPVHPYPGGKTFVYAYVLLKLVISEVRLSIPVFVIS